MQGARLTAWELMHDGIPVTLQADGAAASLMAGGSVGWVIVGSDRIAANGDVANKIGTYGLAVMARYHGIKVMVAAPTSTVDMEVASGAEIPIEERDPEELLGCGGRRHGPGGLSSRAIRCSTSRPPRWSMPSSPSAAWCCNPTTEKMRALMA